jgi:hypothetical protein
MRQNFVRKEFFFHTATIIPVTTSPNTLTNSFSGGGFWNTISRFYFDRKKNGQLQVEKKNLAHMLPCEKKIPSEQNFAALTI